jgi:hypothetical protein
VKSRGRRIGGFWLLGRRLGASAGRRTVWEARETLPCAGCGEEILAGERYTWGEGAVPYCYGCRPWNLKRPGWARKEEAVPEKPTWAPLSGGDAAPLYAEEIRRDLAAIDIMNEDDYHLTRKLTALFSRFREYEFHRHEAGQDVTRFWFRTLVAAQQSYIESDFGECYQKLCWLRDHPQGLPEEQK